MLDLQLLDDPLPAALDWITQEARGSGGAQVMADLIRALARDDEPLFVIKACAASTWSGQNWHTR